MTIILSHRTDTETSMRQARNLSCTFKIKCLVQQRQQRKITNKDIINRTDIDSHAAQSTVNVGR